MIPALRSLSLHKNLYNTVVYAHITQTVILHPAQLLLVFTIPKHYIFIHLLSCTIKFSVCYIFVSPSKHSTLLSFHTKRIVFYILLRAWNSVNLSPTTINCLQPMLTLFFYEQVTLLQAFRFFHYVN